jgi:hypothetical protein
LALINDQTGNVIPEIANLGRGSSVKVQVKDGLIDQDINTVAFNRYYNPRSLAVFADINGNGAPELGVLQDHPSLGRSDRIELRDLVSGKPLKNIWLGRNWHVLQHARVGDLNGNGADEAAVLRVKGDGAVNVMLRDTRNSANLGSIGFDRNYPPKRLLTLPDLNGNGSEELIVFGTRFDEANQKAQIKDAKTKVLLRAVYFDKDFVAQDIATCPDLNGNGSGDLVVLGQRKRDGKLRAIVKDAGNGSLFGTVDF